MRNSPKHSDRSVRRLIIVLALLVAAATAAAVIAAKSSSPAAQPVGSEGNSPCLTYGPGQDNNGKAVIAAGLAAGAPEDAIVAGLTAGLQETHLLNLANVNVPESVNTPHDGLAADHDAIGILQQRAAWGSVEDRMSPATAAGEFFTALMAMDGWQALPPGELAATVQRSALPESYADDVPAAREFYRSHVGEVRMTSCPPGSDAGGKPITAEAQP